MKTSKENARHWGGIDVAVVQEICCESHTPYFVIGKAHLNGMNTRT